MSGSSVIHAIDIVGGERPDHLSRIVRGQIVIATGDVLLDQRIKDLYETADRQAYALLAEQGTKEE